MLKKALPLLFFISFAAYSQTSKQHWVDSVFNRLEIDQKIGQLLMISISLDRDDYMDKIEEALESHNVGGIIFSNGSPYQLASARNFIQKHSAVPVLLGIDSPGGLGQLTDSVIAFPPPMMLGSIIDNGWIKNLGQIQAHQLKELGFHMNLASFAGISSQLNNSFGGDRVNVAQKAIAYNRGLEDNNIIGCLRGFPIQSLSIYDINSDGLPLFNVTTDSLRWYPYNEVLKSGVKSVIPSTSEISVIYEKKGLKKNNDYPAALLSAIYLQRWLKNQMHYKGLLVADLPAFSRESDLDGGEAEELAFLNGHDILLFPKSLNQATKRLRRLIKKEEQYEAQLDQVVRKILEAKYDAGLAAPYQPILTDNLLRRLNSNEATQLKSRLLERSVILVKNQKYVLPIHHLDGNKIATLSIGLSIPNDFTKFSSSYTLTRDFSLSPKDPDNLDDVIDQLKSYNTILVAIFEVPTKEVITALEKLDKTTNVVICLFNSPTQLTKFSNFSTLVEGWVREDMSRIVPQSIFGALAVDGRLPVDVAPAFPSGRGSSYESLKRLGYSTPEDVGMDGTMLQKIESIAREGILMEGTPGCYVLVAKDGKIVYEHSFGYYTYDSVQSVNSNTLYDLASITKVAATLQSIMFLYDKGLIDINKKASYYLPELKGSNKEDFLIKDILTHQAGLWPFLPFWAQTVKDNTFLPEYYSTDPSEQYPFPVADHLYASASMKDSLWHWIINSKIRDKIERTPYDYKYSDMGFYIFQHLAEKMLNQPIQDFLEQNLYEPLGAYTMGYLPLNRFPASQIAPTEDDKLFRRRLLIGTVHDQGAAMHGGIAGHAGLFSNALDLAKLGQMMLQNGYYGGIQYYQPKTVKLFTSKQFQTSRRGLGWDKPLQSDWHGPTSTYASPETFGHTGFTGTCLWVDPVFNLVYVFLSNRVYPDMNNSKLIRTNIRSRIQDTLYQSIFSYLGKN